MFLGGHFGKMQQAIALNKEGDGDAVSCSTGTSRWSTPSRQHIGSDNSDYSSDFGDQADSLPDKTPQIKTPDQWHGKKGKKAQGPHKQKTNYTANRQVLMLPPIKPRQVSKSQVQSPSLTCMSELKNQVCDLQQQLNEARTENKLLKRLHHRHTVALQHFQDSEGSLPQILTKHSNETRVLQQLLRETRACRDNLARQLQNTENRLLSTKATLHHLELLSQDHSLLEREDLTLRLARASADLRNKDKRIQDLEKNLELNQASFNRQIVTEQRKSSEARKISCHLQEQIYQLNREIQDRERELETHNIYSRRFLKGSSKKGSENKKVQTDGLVLLPTKAPSLLELEYTETEEKLEKQESSVNWCCYNPVQKSSNAENLETEVSANVALEENHQEDTDSFAETSEHRSCSNESPANQTERDCDEEKEAAQMLKEEWKTDDQENETSCISEILPVLEEEYKIDQHESALSDVSEDQQVLVECKIDRHEGEMSNIAEKSLNPTEPKRKGHKLPKIRCSYTFKHTIENLHNGKPAYSHVDLSPNQNTKNPIQVENLSNEICEHFSTSCEIQEGSGLPPRRAKVSSKHKELTVEEPSGHRYGDWTEEHT